MVHLLPEYSILSHRLHVEVNTSRSYQNINRIKTLLQEDEFFNQVKERLRKEPREKRYEGYQFGIDSLLLYNNQLYEPNSADLRRLILDEFQKRPYVGHLGYQKMVIAFRQLYYWSGMK
jgi:hypothetical protein